MKSTDNKKTKEKIIRFDLDKFEELEAGAQRLNVPVASYIKMRIFGGSK